MTKKQLNIALIGCGGMASNYRHVYTQIPGAKLAMLVDIDETVAREAAQELNVDKWSTDYRDCLIPDIDIVDVSTPNFLHAEQSIAALKDGKHVILQKPIAPSVAEAEEIVRVAEETGKKAGMYMSTLDYPITHELKNIIRSGKLGRLSAVHCRASSGSGLGASPDNWRSSLEKTGGGALAQLGVHLLNELQWLLDSRIASIMGYSKNVMSENIGGDDLNSAAFELENGMLGSVSCSYCAPGVSISIYGTTGFLVLDYNSDLAIQLGESHKCDLLDYKEPGKLERFHISSERTVRCSIDNPLEQHIAFVRAVQEGSEVSMPVSAGLHDLRIIKAIYESSEEGRIVNIIT